MLSILVLLHRWLCVIILVSSKLLVFAAGVVLYTLEETVALGPQVSDVVFRITQQNGFYGMLFSKGMQGQG